MFFKLLTKGIYAEENSTTSNEANRQPPVHAGIRLARGQQRVASVGLGGAASEEVAQLLDHDRQARWIAAYDGRVGSVAGWPLRFQHGQQVTQSTQPGPEQKLRRVYRAC